MLQSKVFHTKKKKESCDQSRFKSFSNLSIALKWFSFLSSFSDGMKYVCMQPKNMNSSGFSTYDNDEEFSKSLQSTEASTKLIQLGNNDPKLQDLW